MDQPGRKSLPHRLPLSVDPDEAVFFITICARDRATRPLLSEGVAESLLAGIRSYHRRELWWAHVGVVMPDHVHIVASFRGDLSGTIRNWKRWSGRILGVDWQRDYFDHRLRNEEALREKADYVLQNPVRAGLVTTWEDWPYIWIGE